MLKAKSLTRRVAGFFFVLSALCAVWAAGPALSKSQYSPDLFNLPAEYGEVIYRSNDTSPNQIYIIGMSHRDSLTRVNGDKTARVQAEVYKIGEWLIRNRGLKLLLPEGFFKTGDAERSANGAVARTGTGTRIGEMAPADLGALEKELGDNRTFVNAEMLLKRNYPLYLEQVEDKTFYTAVSNEIRNLMICKNNDDYCLVKSALDYLQDRRTAAMLQKIPGVIQDQFDQGKIKDRKAFFTIGLNHIYKIVKYLNEERIAIDSPRSAVSSPKRGLRRRIKSGEREFWGLHHRAKNVDR